MNLQRPAALHELSLALSAKDRAALLDRIQRSLSVHAVYEDQKVYRRIEDTNQRKAMLESEYQQLDFWSKLIIWLKGLFSPLTKEEIVLQRIMRKTVKNLERPPFDLLDGEGEILKPKFGERLVSFYKEVVVPIQIVRFFWEEPQRLQHAVEYCLSLQIPDGKTTLFRFRSFENLVTLFQETGSKNDIKKVLLQDMQKYLESIPEEVFQNLEQGILPLYWLKELAFFDFGKLFSLFSVDFDKLQQEDAPEFKSAIAAQAAPVLDAFSYALYHAGKLAGPAKKVHKEILAYYRVLHSQYSLDLKTADVHALDPPSDGISPDSEALSRVSAQDLAELGAVFEALPDRVRELGLELPLGEVLKVVHKDPFYRFIAYSPQLRIKDFYANALHLRVLQELDDRFPEIRAELARTYREALFPQGMQLMSYFTESVVQVQGGGHPIFAYVTPCNSLYSFLRYRLVSEQAEVLRMLARIIPERLREAQAAFQFQPAILEDLLMQIERIDEHFNPMSEDGKLFYRTRASAAQDLSQQKAYRSMVFQRDREVKEILDRSMEAIDSISRGLDETLASTIDGLRLELAKTNDPRSGKPLREILKGYQKEFQVLKKLVNVQEAIGEEMVARSALRQTQGV